VPSSLETEIKLGVRSPQSLRRRLRDLGLVAVQGRRLEKNTLFDTTDSRLRKAKCLLRLRSENGRHRVTYKGAPQRSRRYKVRPEQEIEIGKPEPIRSILGALGFREVFRYEKYRTTYALGAAAAREGRGLAEFDETPIGTYLELEGPKPWIDKMAKRLGYGPGDYITASYVALYESYCKERGIRPRNMTFGRGKT
jgi:adenylate cyclase, class 2